MGVVLGQHLKLHATNDEWHGTGKPWVARLTGLDGKYGFAREFLPNPATITEPGIFQVCNFDKKGRKDQRFVLVVQLGEDLQKIGLREETAVEILKSGRAISDIAPYRDTEGAVRIRRDGPEGPILWKENASVTAEAKLRDLRTLLGTFVRDEDVDLDHDIFLRRVVERIQAEAN